MIDPMANLDPTAPVNPELEGDASREVFDMDAYKANFRKMDKIRSFMGIASGCVAGVCGLTGLSGLGEELFGYLQQCLFLVCVYCVDSNDALNFLTNAACFLILHIVVSFSILAAKMNFRLHSYTISKSESIISFLLTDLQKCALSFMLFWTLFFGLVYLF
jgi:hypothetical protein